LTDTVIYVIPLSHPAVAGVLMLEHKGIPYERVSLVSGLHPLLLRLRGFKGGTVPALRHAGRRVQGSRAISRYLDEQWPEPPLFPRAPRARRAVEAAEAWGDEELQDVPRRLFRWALVRHREVRRLVVRANRLPLVGLASAMMLPVARRFAHLSGADDAHVRRHLSELPALLDHADRLLREGVIGVSAGNAATFQIAPSLRLLMNFEQLAPLLEGRPAGRFARTLLPDYPGRVGRVFPPDWLPAGPA
jgi:glutathione S-transferase